MDNKQGGTIQKQDSVSDLHSLKARLQNMTSEQILAELDERTQAAAEAGEELDAGIITAYYEVLDEVDPISIPDGAYERSREIFAQDHPEYAPLSAAGHSPRKRSRSFFRRHRLVLVAVFICLLIGGTAAVAFELPQRLLVTFGLDTFLLGPTSGDMRLSQPTVDGYYTLEDSLADYGVSTYVPTWMPEYLVLKDIVVIPGNRWDSFIASYSSKGENDITSAILITRYKDSQDISVERYEDNGTHKTILSESINVEFLVTFNFNEVRITWQDGNCLGSIYGEFTESEVEEIIKSFEMEES